MTFDLNSQVYQLTRSEFSVTVSPYASENATLIVTDGTLNGVSASIDSYFASRANAVVDGATWTNSGPFYVGRFGQGGLLVQNGGIISSGGAAIGWAKGSSGSVTIRGAGSSWTNRDEMYIGSSGNAEFSIENGATAKTGSSYLAFSGNSEATVTVSGAGSLWTIMSSLSLGNDGNLATLRIEDGGRVTGKKANVGGYSTLGVVHIDHGTWENSEDVNIGYFGAGQMTIENGGQAIARTVGIGAIAGSQGSVSIAGNGSALKSAALIVGLGGVGTLTVADGGIANTKTLFANTTSLLGNGDVFSHGAVLDGVDLRFDATHGTQQVITTPNGVSLHFNFDGTGGLGAGFAGTSTMTIADGVIAPASFGDLGHSPGSHGEAIVTGSGTIWNIDEYLNVGNAGTGKLTVSDGGRVIARTANVGTNNGTQGEVIVTGKNSTLATALDLALGTYSLQPGVVAKGMVTVGDGGAIVVGQDLSLRSGATLNLQPGGTIHTRNFVPSTGFNFSGGTLNISGSAYGSIIVPQLGTIAGSGTVTVSVTNSGSVTPGSSFGAMTINANYTQNPTGKLLLEIMGTMPSEFDQLIIKKAASLAGSLEVVFSEGFMPHVGNSFNLLDWSTRTGTFDSVALPTLADGVWDTSQLYTTGVISVAIAGDFNFDGTVDAADYVRWRADPNRTDDQLNTWRAHFGQSIAQVSATNSALGRPVPEPVGAISILAALSVMAASAAARRSASVN
ncbi:MAG: hypothetical protein U0805_17855 [Pirellulales bacterium]